MKKYKETALNTVMNRVVEVSTAVVTGVISCLHSSIRRLTSLQTRLPHPSRSAAMPIVPALNVVQIQAVMLSSHDVLGLPFSAILAFSLGLCLFFIQDAGFRITCSEYGLTFVF